MATARTAPKKAPKAPGSSAASGIFAVVNFPLLITVIVLVGLGLATVYTATLTDADYSFSRQLLGLALGVAAMVVFWIFDYRRFADWFPVLLILDAALILLPMTPLGFESNGARSWIHIGSFSFQPSEVAKPVTIVMYAAYVARFGGSITSGKDFLKCIVVLLIPFALLATEDLGTGLVIFIIGVVIMAVGGLARRWLLVGIMTCTVGIAGLLGLNALISTWTDGETTLIKQYQMSRLLVFIDQDNPDYADDAYNLTQAKIAVGSGQVTGKGFGNATQSNGGFLPESATDFIFCVYAEQFGFVGVSVLLLLYLALLAVALAIGLRANNQQGSLIVAGVMAMWLFQIMENIGMDIGLMPITGIPLPFMSYGSSFMIQNFICIGLLLSVWARRGEITSATARKARLDG